MPYDSWIRVTLGHSWFTTTEERRADYLRDLETTTDYDGIEFYAPSDQDDDDDDGEDNDDNGYENDDTQLVVSEILGAIKRNPRLTELLFDNVADRLPLQWIADMLAADRVTALRLFGNHDISNNEHGMILLRGLLQCKSLSYLEIEYSTFYTYAALAIALEENDQWNLESLVIAGLSPFGYTTLLPSLKHCSSLKMLAFARSVGLCLDDGINHLTGAIQHGFSSKLQHFALSFDRATPQAVQKLLEALASTHTNLKKLSLGCFGKQPIVLDDSTPMERLVAANHKLELFGVRNLHMKDMTGVFRAMQTNHEQLKEIGLYNTLRSSRNARELGVLLSQNTAPLRKLEIVNFGNENKHGPVLTTLSQGLGNNATLTFLNLYLNEIHDDDLRALALAIETNSYLKTLKIKQDKQRITTNDDAMVRFAQSLTLNQGLTSLGLEWRQNFGQDAIRAFFDGVKVNSTLQRVSVDWLSRGKKAELDFYIKLNCGAKQALHSPLNVMCRAFARADRCRTAITARRNSSSNNTGDKQAAAVAPPNELYFYVRERCELFQEAASVARRRQLSNHGQQQQDDEDGSG